MKQDNKTVTTKKAPKAENKTWTLLAPIVVLVSICLVITAALALTNMVTAPAIKAAEQKARDDSMKIVLAEGEGFMENTGVGMPASVLPVYYKAENGAGYVFFVTGKGFGGEMSIIAGLSADGAIAGTRVLVHNESAGIGTNVVDDDTAYQQQLVGMTDTAAVEAVSGATVSSNGMKAAIQDVLDAYIVVTGGTVEVKLADKPATLTDEVLAQVYPGATFTDVPGGMVADVGTVVYAGETGMTGPVPVAVCFDVDGNILAVVADTSAETPDFGQPLGTSEFMDKFVGVASGSEVDGVSGATITSDAVKSGVDAAIANLATVKGAA